MRISDWSSDVCSSDLDGEPGTAADKVNAPFARRELRLDAGAVRQRDAGAVLEHELAGRIVSDDRLGAAIAEQHPGKGERYCEDQRGGERPVRAGRGCRL